MLDQRESFEAKKTRLWATGLHNDFHQIFFSSALAGPGPVDRRPGSRAGAAGQTGGPCRVYWSTMIQVDAGLHCTGRDVTAHEDHVRPTIER
jgi:hypothetical protein